MELSQVNRTFTEILYSNFYFISSWSSQSKKYGDLFQAEIKKQTKQHLFQRKATRKQSKTAWL